MEQAQGQANFDAADRIDTDSDASVQSWAKKLDVSPEQLREAVQAVGSSSGDVEMHLKGSRASTNAALEQRGEQLTP